MATYLHQPVFVIGVISLRLSQALAASPLRILGTGGTPANVGVLQVQTEEGKFGSVCGVSLAAADVACRQLGFEYGIPASSPCSTYGADNLCGAPETSVAMQDLACRGGELGLSECTWSAPSTECLTHERDSIVYCGSSGAGPARGSVRLLSADGAPSLSQEGFVEIFVNGEWSPVCGMSQGAESVVCKALGFAGAGASSEAAPLIGQSVRVPRLGDLRCSGSETSVLDCSFEAGDDVYCAASEASSIRCS